MSQAPIDSHPLITVAFPTYNGSAHLGAALQSIIAQDGVSFHLLISDDRSDDDSLDVVRRIAGDRARVHQNSERLGLAGNWNRCVALTNTPFISIFHQDDVMKPGHLAAHARALASETTIGLAASASDVIDQAGMAVPESTVGPGGLGPVDRVFAAGELAQSMVTGNPLRCSAVTLRTAAVKEIGGFDASFRYVVDWDCWLRLSRNWGCTWLAKTTVSVRWHLASETHHLKSGLADLDETKRLLEELFNRDLANRAGSKELRARAMEILGRAYLNRAYDALNAKQPGLARDALSLALKHSSRVPRTIVSDPRLAARMTTLAISPWLAGKLFGRPKTWRGT